MARNKIALVGAGQIGGTLGGTGKEGGDRHPKVRSGVMIGAGAKILGNIEVGHCSKVAAGSVLLTSVPNNKTVAGVPARIIRTLSENGEDTASGPCSPSHPRRSPSPWLSPRARPGSGGAERWRG